MRFIALFLIIILVFAAPIPTAHNLKSLKKAPEEIAVDGEFRDWKAEDVKCVDYYDDEYFYNDYYDSSRDIIAFYYREGTHNLYFRIDFLDLAYGAEIHNLDFYIAMDFKSGGQQWLPDFVDTRTNVPWEVCIAVYDTEHYAVYLQDWSYSNDSLEKVSYNSRWDSVELALNKTLLISVGWSGGTLNFQVFTTKDGTNGGYGEIGSYESDIVDAIGSSLYRGDSSHNGWLNGSIGSSDVYPQTRIAFLHHANQFLKNVSYFVGNKEVGMYAVPSIHEYWGVPVNLHISGTLADAIQYYRPNFNEYIRKLVDKGIVSMVGGFYAEYIPKYLPSDFNNWSMHYAKEYNIRYYNYTPRVCWIPERVYWHGWEETVKNGGYDIVVADTEVAFDWYHPSWASEGKDEYYVWEDNGIKVLFISNTGRAGNWQNIQDMLPNPTDDALNINIRRLLVRNAMEDPSDRYILYMDDWEKFFGNAPHWGGAEVVRIYNESIGWIAQHQWIKVTTLEEIADNLPVHGEITIGDASYFWLTQNLGTAGSDSVGPNDNYDLYDAWYYDPYHEITVGESYFNYTPRDNIMKLGDYRTPNTVIYTVWNAIKEIPPNSPIYTVAMKSFAAMMYETAWRGKGISITMHEDISDWEKDQASHIKDLMILYHAQRYLEEREVGVYGEDVDLDGVEEGIISTENYYCVIDSRGGKITFLMDSDGSIIVGNPTVGWHEQGDAYTDIIGLATTNYHYAEEPVPYHQGGKAFCMEDVGFENENYTLEISSNGIIASNGPISKTFSPICKGIYVNYSTNITLGVRITASPDFANLEYAEEGGSKNLRYILNPKTGKGIFIATHTAKYYMSRKITLARYFIYYGKENFSFVIQIGRNYTNLPPHLTKKIPDVYVAEDSVATNVLNLSLYFSDDLDANLNYSLRYDQNPGVYLIINSSYLSVDAKSGEKNDNWFGDIVVEITAYDSFGEKCTGNFTLHIYNVNDPPEVYVNLENNETIVSKKIVTINATDVDGDELTVKYSTDNSSYSEGKRVVIDPAKLKEGKHVLRIIVSDGNCTVIKEITFYVEKPERKDILLPLTISVIVGITLVVSSYKIKKRKSEEISREEEKEGYEGGPEENG